MSREPSTQDATGAPLGVARVRAARQEGFDRVVVELDGKAPGQPGWLVRYVEQPTADGSGDPVAVDGSSYLQVMVTGVGYPMDTGIPEPSARRVRPTDTEMVREVVLNGVHEGQYAAFVGLDRTTAFRVTRMADPARLVIDLQHR